MFSENYLKQVKETQNLRNVLLGDNSFSKQEINLADEILMNLFSTDKYDDLIVMPVLDHSYLRIGLNFTHGWYSSNSKYANPESVLPRASKSRLVLFREYFILSQFITDPWMILNQVCDIKPIKDYVETDCKKLDLNSFQYFSHSTHTIKWMPKEEYNRIDFENCAAILYPMYEGEIIAALVTIVATLLGVEYTIFRNKIKKERKLKQDEKPDDYLISIIQKQNEIIAQMLLEMRVRELKLINLIDSENGTISHKKLKEIYLDSYLPAMETLRISQGHECPTDLIEEQKKSKEYANEITPKLCMGKTENGERCKRLVSKNNLYCWQHKEM